MLGFIILAIVLLGFRGGFTGLTYPLTLVALGLCAFGALNPLFLGAFVPLAAVQHSRMQHPLMAPPILARSGMLPVFGVFGVVFTAVTIFRVLGVGGTALTAAVGVGLVILTVGFAVVRRRARRQQRMNDILHSKLGARYCAIMARTGAILGEPTPIESKTQILTETILEREELDRSISNAGIDPEEFSRFMMESAIRGDLPAVRDPESVVPANQV